MSRPTPRHLIAIAAGGLWIVVAAGALVAGLAYYRLPIVDRPYSELHDLFAPAGLIGHAYGILGTLMMLIGVAMYSARKRWHRLEHTGRLRTWLHVHIFLCTLGPVLVLLHTAFRFGGLISIAFWSMTAVVISGVFGRYVYVRLPKGGAGGVVPPVVLRRRRVELEARLTSAVPVTTLTIDRLFGPGVADENPGLMLSLVRAIRFDFERRRLPGRLRSELADLGLAQETATRLIPDLLSYRDERHQMLTFRPFQRLFGYWHVFHLPLATVMLLIVVLHVAVAVAFGYIWIF